MVMLRLKLWPQSQKRFAYRAPFLEGIATLVKVS